MELISAQRRREIIDALRRGTVPQRGLDVFAVGDALLERGWHHDRQKPPESLHSTVSAGNAPVIEEYVVDLRACVEQVAGTTIDDRSTTYATLE